MQGRADAAGRPRRAPRRGVRRRRRAVARVSRPPAAPAAARHAGRPTPEPSPAATHEAPAASGHQEAAVPIARRVAAAAPVFFPLWLRGRRGPDARMPMVGWFDPGAAALDRAQEPRVAASSASRATGASCRRWRRGGRRLLRPLHPLPRRRARTAAAARTPARRAVARLHQRHRRRLELDLRRGLCRGPAVADRRGAGRAGRRCRAATCWSSAATRSIRARAARSTSAGSSRRTPRPSATTRRPSGRTSTPCPGNHDWYDGLSAFTRLFCSDIGGRRFAGWWTRQRRSYFVLKLPHGWWLVGSDGQLQSDLDVPQIEYFREIAARHMEPGDKAILCLSMPAWVYAQKYRNIGPRVRRDRPASTCAKRCSPGTAST